MSRLKTVLLFTPFVTPMYIPLGIAQLKKYIETNTQGVEVSTLDLNNNFFKNLQRTDFLNLLDKVFTPCRGRCRHYLNNINDRFRAEWYKMGVDNLSNEKSKEFFNPPRYNFLLTQAAHFWDQVCRCLICRSAKQIMDESSCDDCFREIFKEDLRLIIEQKPSLVGFSIFCQEQLSYSLILAKIIKNNLRLPVIFGGAFLSHLDCKELLKFFNQIDFIVDKEGEISLVEFMKNFADKKLESIPGVSYRRNGVTVSNRARFIDDLDLLAPADFSDFDLNSYFSPKPVLPVFFSRGCYWRRCAFCNYHKNYPLGYKKKSIDKFLGEIAYYNKLGFKYFFIIDDVISADNLDRISTAVKKNKLKIFFGAMVRAEGFSEQKLHNIYSAGGRLLAWGIETSSQRLLRIINKGTQIKRAMHFLHLAKRSGFYNHLFMIRGFPGQTESELTKDIEFLQKNHTNFDSFHIHDFILQDGSYIHLNLNKFGIKKIKSVPIYKFKRTKQVLYGDKYDFGANNTLDFDKIGKEKNFSQTIKRVFGKRFLAFSYSHLLFRQAQMPINNRQSKIRI